MQVSPVQPAEVMEAASMPLVLSGLGLCSARRVSRPAYWESWADALAVIRARHPDLATRLIEELEGRPDTPFLRAAAEARTLRTSQLACSGRWSTPTIEGPC